MMRWRVTFWLEEEVEALARIITIESGKTVAESRGECAGRLRMSRWRRGC
jgi:acyl-CoA reductase-like NAD-dependent aldehyde dehydrogenase